MKILVFPPAAAIEVPLFLGRSPQESARRWRRSESREILERRLVKPGRRLFPSRVSPGQHIGNHQRAHESRLEQTKLCFVLSDLRHTFAPLSASSNNFRNC